jgi:aubergine
MSLALATRPKPSKHALIQSKPVKLLANYYKFNFMNPQKKAVFKYSVKFDPEIPENSSKTRNKVINQVRETLKSQYLGFFIFLGGSVIYSLENTLEIPDLEAVYDEVTYRVSISWVQAIGNQDKDMLAFLKIFFNSMLKRIKFKQIGRNFFNPDQSTRLAAYNIEIWPGFSSSLQMLTRGVMLNVDIAHKVLRTDNVLELMEEIKNRCRSDYQGEIRKTLIGATILTSYNKRTYKVDDVDFDHSPKDRFNQGIKPEKTEKSVKTEGEVETEAEGEPVSYYEYYKKKYGAEISNLN